MRIVWTTQAQEDLEAIYQYWLPVNEAYAVTLYNSLIDEADILASQPKAGALERGLEHIPGHYRSLLAGKHHKLIYTIAGNDIVIHAVWNCRQDPDALNKKV